MSANHPAAFPHGAIEEVFPEVFLVTGDMQMRPLMRIKRSMVILRENGELTLLNSVRLGAEGEARLEALGKVRHLVKLGAFHDRDDPYYLERYGAEFWALPRAKHRAAVTVDHELTEDAPLPHSQARFFHFRNAKYPEGAFVLDRDGGILITCDSVQNNLDFDGMSLLVKLTGGLMGFKGEAVIGPFWRKAMERKDGPRLRDDFDRLCEQPFRHLLSGHGTPLRDRANQALRASTAKTWRS